MKTSFRNREDAGKQLAHRLTLELKGTPNMIVLGLLRGGVPVAAIVAQALNAPLDVVLVRKLGLPHDPECAMASVKSQHPDAVIVAIPVGSHAACTALRPLVDELVCLHELTSFQSVGAWYQEFSQTTDETVRSLLETRP